MSESNLTKAGLSVLNMDEIEQYLRIKYNFVTKADNATDVEQVAGIDSERIAVAISPDERTTVENALNLGGIPAEDYMTNLSGSSLAEDTKNVKIEYGKDIADLRDELYQLKSDLAKSGIICNTRNHMGYHDVFRNGYKPYIHECIGTVTSQSNNRHELNVTSELSGQFDAGDYIVLYFKNVDKVNVKQIKEISANGEVITLDQSVDENCTISPETVEIYKSYGVSRDGYFYFSKDKEFLIGDVERYSCLDDDSNFKLRKKIEGQQQGFAYTFRVPESKLGYLTKFEIQVKAVGTPTLTCHIINEEDIGKYKNPEQAKAMHLAYKEDINETPFYFYAKSKPLTLDPTKGQYVATFDFWQHETNSYPILEKLDEANRSVRYCAIIEGSYIDEENYAEVLFLQHENADGTYGDLQLNNTTYYYQEVLENSKVSAMTTDKEINGMDMYYGITTKEKIENDLEAIERGLYTARIHASYPEGISRARLTLRVNREGGRCYADILKGDIYGSAYNKSFTARNEDSIDKAHSLSLSSTITKPMELRKHDSDLNLVTESIIGNHIVRAIESNYDQIVPEIPIYVRPNDMVYRNGYIVSAKGKFYEYNPEQDKYIVSNTKKIYLPLVAIIRDEVKYDDHFSDRLIFEGDFIDKNGKPVFFNDIELQIYWENNSINEFNGQEKRIRMGIIRDLVLTFDRFI